MKASTPRIMLETANMWNWRKPNNIRPVASSRSSMRASSRGLFARSFCKITGSPVLKSSKFKVQGSKFGSSRIRTKRDDNKPATFPALWVGQRPMNDCHENVKFYANPIVEYISRRICCQRFYDASRLRDQEPTATRSISGGPPALSSVWRPIGLCLEVETAPSPRFCAPKLLTRCYQRRSVLQIR